VRLGFDAILLMRSDGGKRVVSMMRNVSIYDGFYSEIFKSVSELFR
jgi:hypothetical protein